MDSCLTRLFTSKYRFRKSVSDVAHANSKSDHAIITDSRCACHAKEARITSKKAWLKLTIACIIALFFMLGEALGELINKIQHDN